MLVSILITRLYVCSLPAVPMLFPYCSHHSSPVHLLQGAGGVGKTVLLAALQRVDEGVGIDAATPGDGDNACTRLHQREGLCEDRDTVAV